ncbi:MAG: CHAT domain-containing protein, partial [Bacteroidota bacterium]
FLLDNKNKLSIVYLKKALKSAEVNSSKESDPYAEILTKTGIYYLNLEKNPDIAISYFKRSIAIYEEKEGDNVLANNNIIEKKKALVGYATALILKYNSTNQINLLYKADTIFANELNKLNDVSNSLAYSDKLLLIEMADPLYNLAIKNSNDILKLTENKIYANKVFNYTERSKSSALLSAVVGEHALKTSDIPIETFNFEHQLKDEINGLQQLLENEKTEDKPSVANIGFFERKLLILINKYDSLIVDIEDKYPKYYSVKYGTKAISPNQVKQNLSNDEAIIEYKLTDSVLYIITITNNDFNVSSIAVDSSFYNSLDYIVSIKSVNLSEENFKKFNDFKYHSNYLWQLLIESSNSLIENKRLIIIPDGILGYLPFDLLIENNSISDSINYRDLPYLIRSHPISYAYSATLKYNTYFNAKSDIPKKSILAFAPLYRGSKLNKNSTLLPPLPFAKEEALKIVANRGGDVFVDEDATKSNFLKYASSNNILHLAMHTIINDSLPMQSKLVFYCDDDDDISSSYMFTHELYNMNLNASMVVLSACNTGTGDLKKGEGIMSLARGFVYSGVPSIVMTLWEVQDASGSLIMNKYYDYLNAGNSKDFALQQAKLSVLKDANMAKAHPFFWSTYIISGDTSSLIVAKEKAASNTSDYYWIFGMLAVLVASIFLFYRLKKHPVQVS